LTTVISELNEIDMANTLETDMRAVSRQCRALLKRVDAHAKKVGVMPKQVVKWATGNNHLYDRLQRRANLTADDMVKIDAYLSNTERDT